MNVFEYVKEMKAKDSIVALVGVALLALFLLIIILKMLGGMRRGFWRQLARTGTTLLAAIGSYIASVWLSNHIIGMLDPTTTEELITKIDSAVPGAATQIQEVISTINPQMIEYILLLPATIIIIPILTIVLFLVVNLILKIIRAIVVKIIGIKKAKSNPERLGGAVLAAVEFLIWISVIMIPVCGSLSLANQTFEKAISTADENSKAEFVEIYDEYLLPFVNNPAVSFIGSISSDAMSNGIATVKINNEKTNMRDEVLSVAHIILIDGSVLKDADFTALNAEEKEAVTSIINALSDSPFMANILVEVIHTVPTIYESGLIPTDDMADFQHVIDHIMVFMKTVKRQSLADDLNTLKDVYFGFCDSGIMSAITEGQDLMKFISDDYNGDKHLLGMINTLSGNVRTKGIVDQLYNMVLSAAFSGSGNSDGSNSSDDILADIKIEDVKQGLNDIVSVNKSEYSTEEEYREALSDTISTTINNTIGVELEKEVVDEVANYVDENFSEQFEDLTDEEFNEMIFEVIDIYQSYLNGEEINPDDLNNLLPGGADNILPDGSNDFIPGGSDSE